jgi:hypothetical protein
VEAAAVDLRTTPAAVAAVLAQQVKLRHRLLQKAALVGLAFNLTLMAIIIIMLVAAAETDSNLVMVVETVGLAAAAVVQPKPDLLDLEVPDEMQVRLEEVPLGEAPMGAQQVLIQAAAAALVFQTLVERQQEMAVLEL